MSNKPTAMVRLDADELEMLIWGLQDGIDYSGIDEAAAGKLKERLEGILATLEPESPNKDGQPTEA